MKRIHVQTLHQYTRLLWPEFVEIEGVFFLKSEKRQGVSELCKRFPTQTEYDDSHTHILDIVRHQTLVANEPPCHDESHPDFVKAYEIGRMMCRMWAVKLLHDFPQYDFRVYLHGEDPIVRFHKVRPGIPNMWEEYDCSKAALDTGSVLIVDTRDLRREVAR